MNKSWYTLSFWFLGWYFLMSADITGRSYTGATATIYVLVSAIPVLLIYIPISKNIHHDFVDRHILIPSIFIITSVLFLWVYTIYEVSTYHNYIAMSQFNLVSLYIISITGAILTGVSLTASLKRKKTAEMVRAWLWSAGIFIIQIIFSVFVLLSSIGPII